MAGSKPPQILSEDEAKEIVAKTMGDEWKKSAEYKKLERDSEGKYVTQTVTTKNRFTEILTKKRAARIIEEKPGTTEEAAFAQAEKDVLKRESDDKKNVSESTDPIAAKILTNISSILMDISEDVVALRESGSNALDKAEADREKGKGKEGEEEKEKEKGKSKFEIFLDGVIVMLAPFFLGLASKIVDLTKPFGLLIGTLVAITGMLVARFAALKAISVTKNAVTGIFSPKAPTTGLPGATVPGTPEIPSPAGNPTTTTAGKAAKPVSVLTNLGKGIKDLGAGIGGAVKVFLTSLASGLASFGNPKTIKGIAVITLATAALGGIAYLFKKGGLEPKHFLAVGAGLITLAGGLMIMGSPPVLAAANALGLALVPMAKAAGVIALLGAALIPGAYAFNLFGEALKLAGEGTENIIDNLFRLSEIDAGKLLQLGPALMSVGAGFLAFNAAMAVGTLAGIGQSIAGFFGAKSPIDQVLNFAKDAADADIAGAAEAINKLAKAIKQLDSISGANLFNIGAGLTAVSAGLVAFSASNVTAGLGNLVSKFLSFLSGGKTPVEQIIELSEKHRQIFEAGRGVESMGKGIGSFAGVDTEKLSRTIEIITKLSDSDLEKLAKFQVVQSQPAATQQLGQAREEVNTAQSNVAAQNAPAVVNNVNQTAVNKSDTTYKSTRSGPAVKGDALLMGA